MIELQLQPQSHILFFEEKPTLYAGGQERSLFELAKRFFDNGYKVSLCYKEEGDLLVHYQSFCTTTIQLRSNQLRVNSVVQFIKDIIELSKIDNVYNFSLFYSNQYFDVPFVTAAGIVLNKKSVCHLRLPAPSYLSRQYKFFLEKTNYLIAISKHTLQTYRDAGIRNSNLFVQYNDISKPKYIPQKKKPNGIYTITYAGRICPEKGSELLLRSFSLIGNKYSNVELRYYGNARGESVGAEYLDYLKQLTKSLKLENKVHYYPHQENFNDIAKHTDIFVLPSIWPEPFGRTIVEAYHHGVTTIATKVGGIPEVMANLSLSEHLVEPNQTSIAAKLEEEYLKFARL